MPFASKNGVDVYDVRVLQNSYYKVHKTSMEKVHKKLAKPLHFRLYMGWEIFLSWNYWITARVFHDLCTNAWNILSATLKCFIVNFCSTKQLKQQHTIYFIYQVPKRIYCLIFLVTIYLQGLSLKFCI